MKILSKCLLKMSGSLTSWRRSKYRVNIPLACSRSHRAGLLIWQNEWTGRWSHTGGHPAPLPETPAMGWRSAYSTLIKKRIKFYSYLRKFRVEQLQSHIWLTASSYMRKIWFSFLSVHIKQEFICSLLSLFWGVDKLGYMYRAIWWGLVCSVCYSLRRGVYTVLYTGSPCLLHQKVIYAALLFPQHFWLHLMHPLHVAFFLTLFNPFFGSTPFIFNIVKLAIFSTWR
jgi:hypothetical protein